jgi:hypothetical protein
VPDRENDIRAPVPPTKGGDEAVMAPARHPAKKSRLTTSRSCEILSLMKNIARVAWRGRQRDVFFPV